MALLDSFWLSQDSVFGERCFASLMSYCDTVANETSNNLHAQRKSYVATILNNPSFYKQLFINVASINATVVSTANQSNTVPLTTTNTAAQAALVTDTQVNNAVAACFNDFISGI